MKKTDKMGIVMIVFGALFVISGFSLFSQNQIGSAIAGLAIGAILIVLGVKRIQNPPAKKPSQAELTQEQIAARLEAQKRKEANFKATINSIPKKEISCSHTELQRYALNEIPEIKTANIAKTFNPSSLPAFVVIDTETTGLKAASDRIIELSAIMYEDYAPVSCWSTRIKIDSSIPQKASDINGIYDSDLEKAPYLEEVAESFLSYIGSLPIVGYNIGFDLKFLFCSGINLIKLKQKKYDVLSLARQHFKYMEGGYSLENVCDELGIYYIPHKSISDCYATGELFKAIISDRTGTYIG